MSYQKTSFQLCMGGNFPPLPVLDLQVWIWIHIHMNSNPTDELTAAWCTKLMTSLQLLSKQIRLENTQT